MASTFRLFRTPDDIRTFVQKVLEEDVMRGVPEFVIYEIARKATNELRAQLARHVLIVASSEGQRREALQACEEPLRKLGDDIAELIEDRLWGMLQATGV